MQLFFIQSQFIVTIPVSFHKWLNKQHKSNQTDPCSDSWIPVIAFCDRLQFKTKFTETCPSHQSLYDLETDEVEKISMNTLSYLKSPYKSPIWFLKTCNIVLDMHILLYSGVKNDKKVFYLLCLCLRLLKKAEMTGINK